MIARPGPRDSTARWQSYADWIEAESEKWKRIAQDRCTCVKTCGDTPEDSGGVCKQLPREDH